MRAFARSFSTRTSATFQVVDVFAGRVFTGNPTCVVFPSSAIEEDWMSKVAREMNQPTTNFVLGSSYRTFLPTGEEIPSLSGHSSLGVAAAVLKQPSRRMFSTKYGDVELAFDGKLYEIAFPKAKDPFIEHLTKVQEIASAINSKCSSILNLSFMPDKQLFFAEIDADTFATLEVNKHAVKILPSLGLFVTTKGHVASPGFAECADGEQLTADFSVRYFIPKWGIDEDVATGSIQVALNKYWSVRLGKSKLLGLQASKRGGLIWSRDVGDFVQVAGQCAFSFRGTI